MRIQPLIQSSLFDVADWQVDSEFAIFPQGARAKEAVFAPKAPADPVIVGDKRYLFKRSKRCYPDQFWGEVVAYRIGCLLGVEVPPAFVAYNSRTGHCAALIEWFYTDGVESLIMGGEFLQQIFPDFDRKHGTHHNVIENTWLMRSLSQQSLVTDWIQWWVHALLFDALIGNTDRHQDNWGLIFSFFNNKVKCKLTPLFDNGTSLGHERFPNKVKNWEDIDIGQYINNTKACHHVKWSREINGPVIKGHFELLERALEEWPEMREEIRTKLNFSLDDMSEVVNSLSQINAPEPFSRDRITFVLRLLAHRYKRLKSLLL
ncbi:HipA domain-containing protein [Candidatus Nitrotoga arctica]|uniref:HipA_C domain-containing protein n=1 Tax=Candidatus Nitrotoga arctica TaxID=453162 RepID=A0ABN8AGL5_9PROT|nr:HipA domain-containing protein [Candidatus Nitrotoga arctica]CAG9931884.1 HipA_C domain-containing protein [Candidatus Nitrotoga arctica]